MLSLKIAHKEKQNYFVWLSFTKICIVWPQQYFAAQFDFHLRLKLP